MKTWKLLLGFLAVSLLSAAVAVGAYSVVSKKERADYGAGEFRQTGFQAVGYNMVAAENTDFTLAAEQSVNAVVHIKSVVKPQRGSRSEQRSQRSFDPFEFFFGDGGDSPFSPYQQRQAQPRVGFGSGVIISTDGYIVTNNHVIEGADEIEVTTNDDKTFTAKLIGRDPATDLALLKIEGNNFHVLPFGDSDVLKVGEWILAVGNPFNLTSTVTAGIVSAKGRGDIDATSTGEPKIQSYIQTDAAVNPGNSGGALVNTKGELVGIYAAIYSQTGNFVGYSFAIPVNIVKKVIADIKEYGMVQRAVLGIETRDLSMKDDPRLAGDAKIFDKLKETEGVYIYAFPDDNSPSKKAGLQVGDIITSINGAKVKSLSDLKAQLNQYSPGNKVTVEVNRNGASKKVSVELKNEQGTTELTRYKSPADILGAEFKPLSKEAKNRLGVNFGLEVTNLKDGKLKEKGIRNGFIILTANNSNVTTAEELVNIVEETLKESPDERGLYIRGFYPDTKKVEYYAIDLNN
ncbi:MAG: Do family serine endopeptidase [Dysgonamonadaceae bacterium]|jgi:Do/DeqQ family serine protease|nr:Do family serine endopeptidase [Dysgonamonadaceae bacterium]